jgi:signal transduction histidine kinase
MSMKYKILLPLSLAFLTAILITGFLAVDAAARAVEGSFRREMLTARGFLTRMRPPLSPESLNKMKKLFQTDLAVTEGPHRLLATTLAPADAASLQEALRSGGLSGALRNLPEREEEADPFLRLPLGERDFRVLGGRLEGPPSASGAPLAIVILLDEDRIVRAKQAAILPGVAAAGLGILLLLVVGQLVAYSVTRRLKSLSETASRIAAGEETGRVQAEGRDELGAFARAFNQMVDALAESRDRLIHSERMAALGKLASAVAHEIRNPLSSIRMTAEILRPDLHEPEKKEALDLLLKEIQRLEMFLAEILTLSGGIALHKEEADPAELAGETLALLRSQLAHLEIQVQPKIPQGLVHPLDRDRLKQVLMNLLINGAHAAGPGGEVRLHGEKTAEGELRLEVWDSGPGVDPESEPHIFEPFFTTRKGGTGLGLAVSRRIVEAHGGRLAVRREGEWTVFSVDLPAGSGEPGRPDSSPG